MTYYELLQVTQNASLEVIAASYKALMRRNHPDVGGDPKIAQQLNEAYSVLSDPHKRPQYDATLRPAPNPFAAWAEQARAAQSNPYRQHAQGPNAGMGFTNAVTPADRFNAAMQSRLFNLFDRLADHLEQQAEEFFEDPGQGTVYQMPSPRRRRRA